MALFITLGLISRPSAKMLNLAQHADYAQHLSVYAVSCTVHTYCGGTRLCIRSSLLCEPVSQRVAIATSCDAVSSRKTRPDTQSCTTTLCM